MKSLSRVRLFVTPWTVAYQAPLSIGFSRQEYWSGLPFPSPGDLPDPGIEPGSSALQVDSLPSEPPGECVCWRGGEWLNHRATPTNGCSSRRRTSIRNHFPGLKFEVTRLAFGPERASQRLLLGDSWPQRRVTALPPGGNPGSSEHHACHPRTGKSAPYGAWPRQSSNGPQLPLRLGRD